ncbi:MAG: HD domain-containing protein [Candidatus Omnitrophica bacterium]|nr:HD domain-containing protein [Candidatus Omnitrophota bacterium]MBU1811254.1 HD domain-containing protein [Candidatus Omnitrophota bacterium]MBU2504415.1 HD domain-containing protein [Candidatus Omnitrophota bacterium]
MKRYKDIFSTFHAMYRLISTSPDMKNFISGISRLYKKVFDADEVVIICKNVDFYGFMKFRLKDKKQFIKKGGVSIITRGERSALIKSKEILLDNKFFYPFTFEDTLGTIYLRRKSKNKHFNELEKKLFLSISEEVSVGLKIFNLYYEEKRMMINYIKSLTQLLERHVPTSYLHTKNIFRLLKAMGKKMRLSEVEIRSLEHACLLHDAGKIQLPSKLLRKQKPLTGKEFKLIMKHPRKGVELIKDSKVLKPVIPIILHHHERYDGKGYPYKLKKEQIPLGSRILAVIDTFDAMYFGRPYRKRKNLKEVLSELEKQKGRQFDPKVVEIFLQVVKRENTKKYLRTFA